MAAFDKNETELEKQKKEYGMIIKQIEATPVKIEKPTL